MLLKIGHRGAAGYEPENTLRSVKKAIDLGANQIEVDVHVCKTGEVVVIHDDNVKRTTDWGKDKAGKSTGEVVSDTGKFASDTGEFTSGTGKVADMTFEELRKLDAGKGEKIPTLEEVIFLVHDQAELNIEVKNKEDMGKVIEVLQRLKVKNVVLSSAHPDALLNTRKFKTAFIFYIGKSEFYERIMLFTARMFMPITKKMLLDLAEKTRSYALNVHHSLATRGFIGFMHSRGIKVNVWTLNDEKKIEKYKKNGVDGIISDYPDRL